MFIHIPYESYELWGEPKGEELGFPTIMKNQMIVDEMISHAQLVFG